MASATVSTPIKSHAGLFSSRTAGGRMPLTPSPRQRSTTTMGVNMNTSPFTPERQSSNDGCKPAGKSIYNGNLSSHFAKSSRSSHRDSPKSNIARGVATPRKALELGVSDFTLVGTGNTKTPASTKSKKLDLDNKRPKTSGS